MLPTAKKNYHKVSIRSTYTINLDFQKEPHCIEMGTDCSATSKTVQKERKMFMLEKSNTQLALSVGRDQCIVPWERHVHVIDYTQRTLMCYIFFVNIETIFLLWFMVFNATFNNISAISRGSVLFLTEFDGLTENHETVTRHTHLYGVRLTTALESSSQLYCNWYTILFWHG